MAKKYTQLNPIIVVVLHHYDFTENTVHGLSALENIFRQLSFEDDLTITSLSRIAKDYKPDTSMHHIKAYNNLMKLNWRLKKLFPDAKCF